MSIKGDEGFTFSMPGGAARPLALPSVTPLPIWCRSAHSLTPASSTLPPAADTG